MREFEQKRIIKKRVYSKFTTVVLLIILVLLVNGAIRMYLKVEESKKQLDLATNKLEELDKTKSKLAEDLEDLNSVVGQEEEARKRYSVAKADEQAIIIIDKEGEVVFVEEDSFFESVWDKFISLITF